MSEIFRHQFENGLWLVAEPMPGVQSLAMACVTPGGLAYQPAGQDGVAPVLSEMLVRGAGDLDARAHSDALDALGVQRGTDNDSTHQSVSASMISHRVDDALPLLLDMIRRPRLDADALEPARDLALQEIDGIDDEPQQKTLIDLRLLQYPQPFNRSPLGEREHIEGMTIEQVRAFHRQTFVPQGSVISFAGKLDFDYLKRRVGELLGDWRGSVAMPEKTAFKGGRSYQKMDTAQMHIGLGYPTVPESHPDSLLQRAAVAVLSGGMSGRLFTEVREKRGLCYAVMAMYVGHRDFGAVLAYSGTTPPRAQETLDVLSQELRRLGEGVEQAEFDRAIVGMKSRLVMQGESTAARANAIASDQWIYGRPRTLEERAKAVDAITLERLNAFVGQRRIGDMALVTIGPNELNLAAAAAAS